MTHKDGHNSLEYPNIHLYRILAANWLKCVEEISQPFLSILNQFTEAITHATIN